MFIKIKSLFTSLRSIRWIRIFHIHQKVSSAPALLRAPEGAELHPLGTIERIEQLDHIRVHYRRLHKAAITAQKQQALEQAAKRFVNKEVDHAVRR